MLITLYVLNFNYKRFLSECLDSVLSQSDSKFEIILVDNGSNDGSAQVLKDLAAQKGWRFLQFDNLSLGAVGNNIMRIAKGRYVVRLDADDILADNYIANMRRKIVSESPDVVFSNYYYIDGTSEVYGGHNCLPRGRGHSGYHDEPINGACTLINVDKFLARGGYDEDLPCQDGFDLYMKMRASKIGLLEDYGFYYRRGHKSLSSQKQRLFNARNVIIERRFENEGVSLPHVSNLLLCPSYVSTPKNHAKDSVLGYAEALLKRNPEFTVAIVLGNGDDESKWPKLNGLDYFRWGEKESLSISSTQLIERLSSYYRSDYICTVNLAEAVASPDYISAAPKYAMLMETDGAITGTRFDSSLFRPVVGGVSQVTSENVTRDVDRWVVHTGGVTCRKMNGSTQSPVYSLLEVEPSALEGMLDI